MGVMPVRRMWLLTPIAGDLATRSQPGQPADRVHPAVAKAGRGAVRLVPSELAGRSLAGTSAGLSAEPDDGCE